MQGYSELAYCIMSECYFLFQDIKSPFSSSLVGLDLDVFLTHFHHISRALTPQAVTYGGNRLKEHCAVAWLLTSPALGVTLDWQVQETLLNLLINTVYW